MRSTDSSPRPRHCPCLTNRSGSRRAAHQDFAWTGTSNCWVTAPRPSRARSALTAWKHFDLGWVEIFPPAASIEPGTNVAILVSHLGFWSLNGCRVLYPVVSADGGEFGFAYGTLTNHAEMGEEIFKVVFNPESGAVSYSISAASRPRAWLARCGYPATRLLQARFRRDSARALARAVT